MQITRHVNNKWHKSTFYDRIYEQTINSGAKTGGEKSARKWNRNESNSCAPIPFARFGSVRIYWCFCNSRFTIATSNAFEKLKRKSNNNQRTNKKHWAKAWALFIMYPHMQSDWEIVTNPKCTLLFTVLIFAFIIHSTYLCRWVSRALTPSIQWFPLPLSVYIILGATLFLLFASVCDFLPRIISFWLYAWCWFFGANRS